MRVGYETIDEEKRKNKFKPAPVKEPTSHTRLLHLGSLCPLDNHPSQALSNGIDPAPTRTSFWLEFLHSVPPPCIACKSVSSRHRLELFVFSSRYTLGLDVVCRFSWLHPQDRSNKFRSAVLSVSYQQAADKRDDESLVWCSTYLKSTPRTLNHITKQLYLKFSIFFNTISSMVNVLI